MLNCRRRSCMPTTKSHTGSPTWVMAAMFQICPNDMMAASQGSSAVVTFGGVDSPIEIVERANKTLQDRLVKELRLQGIGTIAAGNEALPDFLADYNDRFGKEPRNLNRSSISVAAPFVWR